MELLLRADVPELGRRGELVKVATGYARNYLIPRGLAVRVDSTNLKQLEEERRRLAVLEQRRLADIHTVADSLSKISLTIPAKATDEGHLFGSVTAAEVSAALRAEGFDVEDAMVQLETHIKELGMFEVAVRLDEAVSATVKVWVVAE